MKRKILIYVFLISLALFWQIGDTNLAQKATASVTDSYECGDVNTDNNVNILDITYLIVYLYQSGSPPPYPNLADVNNSGSINILDITYLVTYLYKGGSAPDCPPGTSDPAGSVAGFSGCKTFSTDKDTDTLLTNWDCIEYEYDGESILQLKHVNGGFNCCPSSITADINIDNNIITIVEAENFDTLGPCWCLCLFDVDYEIINLPPGEYTIQVTELNLMEGDDLLEFTVDLTTSATGDFCVYRDHYPWGFDYGPWGTITGTYGCKGIETWGSADKTPSDQDCIEYEYDGDVLLLDHINAGFNCCPVIQANITVEGEIITITENETFDNYGPCYCLCLFDVNYQIIGVEPGQYTIIVNQLYLDEGDDLLQFEVDLSAPTSGSYCVTRDHYPWGIVTSPSGTMIDHSGCKLPTDALDSLLEEDCVVYDYDGEGVLSLTHLNDLFNCCPDVLWADITIEADTITIEEWESTEISGGCDCICLFDLYYEIVNLPPGEYVIRVINSVYVNWYGNGEIIEFTIDLTTTPSGYFCIDRDYLPWIY